MTSLIEKRRFVSANFPHIDLNGCYAYFNRTGKLWPLCEMKSLMGGCCNAIPIISDRTSEELGRFENPIPVSWEWTPKIKSCFECKYHKENCHQKHEVCG